MTSRRQFLKAIGATALLPLPVLAQEKSTLKIGLIADVHKDVIHDADSRLQAFIDAMKAERADAVIQMGDFCIPKPANQGFLDIFRSFPGPQFHVIGNHDTDGGFKREQVVAFYGMKDRYYSFDLADVHFVVLDANDRPKDFKSGYPSHIADDQIAWLEKDLAATQRNTFILSHQSLEVPSCITSQEKVRAVLEKARTADGKRKVAACLNGHWHIDHTRVIQDIPYHHLNSASYYWLGSKYRRERLEPELAKKFPWVSSTAPYTKPLFTVLEIDLKQGRYSIRAARSEWMGPSPSELGYQSDIIDVTTVRPQISAREGKI